MNFWCCRGANSETQWYWPPVVGALGCIQISWQLMSTSTNDFLRNSGDEGYYMATYMEPISAMEVLMKPNPTQQMKNIQMRPAVPPFPRPNWDTLIATSHDAMRIMEKPNMDTNRKFL